MEEADLSVCAEHNRGVFDDVLSPYVAMKLEQVLGRLPVGKCSGWFDASGCVWCLFDDEKFVRSGDAGRRLRDELGVSCPLQVYWSMGDVMMPDACDERWVAARIAAEAEKQLSSHGYKCKPEEREEEGAMHLGVCFCKTLRWWTQKG